MVLACLWNRVFILIMKTFFLLFFIFIFNCSSFGGQSKDSTLKIEWSDCLRWRKTNTFFVEVGGYSLISPTYDKIIYVKKSLKLSVRAGFSFFPGNEHEGRNTFTYLFPIGLNAFWGKGKHHFQTGIGELYVNEYIYPDFDPSLETENIDIFATLLFFGYRYQKPTGGLFFQAGLVTPILEIRRNTIQTIGQLIPLGGGIGIGYSFLNKGFKGK